MKKKRSEPRRVMLAVTETSSLLDLWRAAMRLLGGRRAELISVFVADDRRRRAASLPFTEEVSRFGGARSNFTRERAEQVDRDAVERTQGQLRQLAEESKIQFSFEIIGEHEAARIREYVTSDTDVLIVPSFLKGMPIYTELTRLKCRIEVVDSEDLSDMTPSYRTQRPERDA